MRSAALSFLERHGWAGASTAPIAGDLSARHYVRLSKGPETAVLMDASAVPDSIAPFLSMTNWLRALGLSAPAILANDQAEGLLLIEDLGTQQVSTMLGQTTGPNPAMDLCVDLLLVLRSAPPPQLSNPTPHQLCDWTTLADDHYPNADRNLLEQFRAVLEPVLTEISPTPVTVSLRDFHADNLMWLPDRYGVARLGLLDYQDAMLTHPVYDLVSLLTDARTEIPRDLRQHYIHGYAVASGDARDDLERAFAAFSLQRNLRILGIFYRAAEEHGKTHHLPKVPRVYRYLEEALEHPVFAGIRPLLPRALPRPEGTT